MLSILLLFPDGQLPSARWRPVGAVAVISVVALVVGAARELLSVAALPAVLLQLGVVLSAIASVVVRFRRARGLEREQLKWFAFGAAGIPLVALAAIVLSLLLPQASAGIGENAWPLSVAGLPIAMGMAILRLRLYDIDVLINRTVVYGATTAAIAVTFFGAIVIAQSILRPFTGGSEIAVAISTLGSVALAQPVRGRIQRAVDRRFYRSRYGAQQIVDTFASRLRDEVDLDDVRTQLLSAVQATVQPRSASRRLRDATR